MQQRLDPPRPLRKLDQDDVHFFHFLEITTVMMKNEHGRALRRQSLSTTPPTRIGPWTSRSPCASLPLIVCSPKPCAPSGASKARLAELLFTRASEPRPPTTIVAYSHPPAHLRRGGECTATSMRKALDAADLRGSCTDRRVADARPEGELLTMLHVSKACLVCQGW